MDMILDVRLNPREICTAQQKGACIVKGRIRFFTKRSVAASNQRIENALVDAMRDFGIPLVASVRTERRKTVRTERVRDTIPRRRPVRLDVVYFFPFPASTPSKRRQENAWMVEQPDLDNLTKSVQDVLTELRVWEDDAQVAAVHLEKHRTDVEPRIAVRVRTVDNLSSPEHFAFRGIAEQEGNLI